MPSNRYTRLFDPGIIRGPEFVPMPFSELAQAGATKQHRYDETKGALDKSLLDANIKSIEYHDQPRQQYIQSFNKAANDLVQSGVDFGSPEGRSKVSNLLYQYKNNPDLQTYGRSVENFKKQQEHIADIKKKPGEYKEYNDPTAWDEKLYKSGRNPYVDPETGRPKEYTFRPVEAASDQTAPAYDIFNKIKDSGKITAYASPNEAQTYIASGKKGWEGVSLDTIKNAAQDNIPTYKQSAGGKDFLREFHYNNFEKLQNLPPEQIQQAEDNAVLNQLTNIGSLYVRNKTTQDADLKATALLAKKAEQDAANLTTSTQSEGVNQNITYNKAIDDMSFEKGQLKMPKTPDYKVTPRRDEFGVIDPNHVEQIGSKDDPAKLQEHKALIDSLKKQYNLSGTDEEVVKAYKSAVKAISNESLPLESISNNAAKGIGESILRNKQQRNFYVVDGKGGTTDGTLESALKAADIKEEDLDKALKAGIGGFSQAGPVAGANYVSVKDSDGKSRRIFISPDDQQQRIFSASHKVNEARKTLQPQTITPYDSDPSIKILVKPNISKTGTPSWNYVKVRVDNSGKIVESENTTLDKIRQEEKDYLKTSNYLGSQISDSKDEQKDVD